MSIFLKVDTHFEPGANLSHMLQYHRFFQFLLPDLIYICRTAMRVTKYMVTGFCAMTPCILVDMYRHSERRAAPLFRIKLYSEFAGSVSLSKSVALLPKNITSHPEDIALRSQLCA